MAFSRKPDVTRSSVRESYTLPLAVVLIAAVAGLTVPQVPICYRLVIEAWFAHPHHQPVPAAASVGAGRPIAVAPADDLAGLVSSNDVQAVVRAALPRWHTFKLSRVLHAFELWGSGAAFSAQDGQLQETPLYSGEALAAVLLDHRAFRRSGMTSDPLLVSTKYGVRVSLEPATLTNFGGTSGHLDDLLRACATDGLSLDTQIVTANGDATVRDMLRHSLATFTLEQEIEWTVEALARYLPPQTEWNNRFGERYDFNQCVDKLIAAPLGQGACLGTHNLYSLAILLRVNEVTPILAASSRRRIEARLMQAAKCLEGSQHANGAWGKYWQSSTPHESATTWVELTSTGHHLEWMAIAPAPLRPARKCIARAARRIATITASLTSYEETDYYLPIAHAARALCLLKGVTPLDALAAVSPR